MKYLENKTQEQRILNLLIDRGSEGAYVYELQTPRPEGLGIAQYNARILGLRRKGYNIINTVPGHFVLAEGTQSMALNRTTEPLNRQVEIDGEVISI